MTARLDTTAKGATCVIGDAVFSSWTGATLSGRDALFGRHHDLAEMRNMPGFNALPQNSVVYFCRNATVDTEPGRFVGAFRMATDQKNRPGLHGYGVLVVGQDMDGFDIAFDALKAFDQVEEADYARIASATDFFDAQHSPDTYRPSVSLFRSGQKATYALDASHDRFETWQTLWVLSFTNSGVRDVYASSGFGETGMDPLPARPSMPSPRPPVTASQTARSRESNTPNAMAYTQGLHQGGHASPNEEADASLLDLLIMPIDTRDPDLLAERLSIAHQTIHELVALNQEHDQRLTALENVSPRSSGSSNAALRTQAKAGASKTGSAFGERDLYSEVEARSWWPEIAIGTTLLILLLCVIAFLFFRVF